ncbi:MAG: T9SS type A sorting domain-containing protein [Treponema sp.]|nr:T9SS type A sorting domain-containing protein [Treponema sp.]
MKKNVLLLLSGILFSVSVFGQCWGKLEFQCNDVLSIADEMHPSPVYLDNRIFHADDTLSMVVIQCENVSGMEFKKGLLIMKARMLDEQDRLLWEAGLAAPIESWADKESKYYGFRLWSKWLYFRNYPTGNYRIKAWVDSLYMDGEYTVYCDSIQELSSKTVSFRIENGSAVKDCAESTLKVFPNPASEQLNVTCGEEMQSLALFNPTGQRVRQMEPCGTEAQIPLSGLPRGLYLLRVQTASGSAVRKVVVE